jgi:hypothetical protein
MQLSTGQVVPRYNKYGTENLKLVIGAVFGIFSTIERIRQSPPPSGFFRRAWQWIKGIFANASTLEKVMQDLIQIAANAKFIREEIADLNGAELQELVWYVARLWDIENPRKWITETLPNLLDALQNFGR